MERHDGADHLGGSSPPEADPPQRGPHPMGDVLHAAADAEFEVSDLRQPDEVPAVGLAPRRRSHRIWRSSAVILLPLLALSLVAVSMYGPVIARRFAPEPAAPLVLRPQQRGMPCLDDAAWSPDGRRVALLGDGHLACGSENMPGRVLIYDGRSGRLLSTFSPAVGGITAAVQSLASATSPSFSPMSDSAYADVVSYQHILWSPDGTQLALTFTVNVYDIPHSTWQMFLPDGEPAQPIGVLLQHSDGTEPRAFVQLQGVYFPFQGDQGAWDLRSGSLVATPSPPTSAGGSILPGSILTPALGYAWQPDGALAPLSPLAAVTAPTPPTPPSSGPVGNPIGAATFSIWQPGFATAVMQTNEQGLLIHLAGFYTWQTSITAWSPDARYLLVWSGPVGLLSLPKQAPPTQADLGAFQVQAPWGVPLRDVGLRTVLSAISPYDPVGMGLAWRPDGRVVAAFAPWNQSGAIAVHFYDCASGRLLASVATPTPATNPLAGQSDLARWSPDGSRLLLFDLAAGQVVIWGPAQLHLPA